MHDLRLDRKDVDSYAHLLAGTDAVACAAGGEALGAWAGSLSVLWSWDVTWCLVKGFARFCSELGA